MTNTVLYYDSVVLTRTFKDKYIFDAFLKHQNDKLLTKDILNINSGIKLGYDADRSLTVPNAGGNSILSEAISIELYSRLLKINSGIKLEMEINYWVDYKIIDYLIPIHTIQTTQTIKNNQTNQSKNYIGVSVTRAMGFPDSSQFTQENAKRLLYKKIYGLYIAQKCITKAQSFDLGILHVLCQDSSVSKIVQDEFAKFDFEIFNGDINCKILLHLTTCEYNLIY